MLAAYPKNRNAGASLAGSAWIDLVAPTDAEKSAFEQAFGLRVPTEGALAEIETTSRLRSERDALYMSVPLIVASPDGAWMIAATGFVLSKNVLMTVRFAQLPAFDEVTAELSAAENLEPSEAFTRLLEKLVDHIADQLEATANDLDSASRIVFREKGPSRPSRESAVLRRLMMRTGRTSERMSHSHYTLVCLERIAKFAIDRGRDWIGAERITRLQTVSSDLASLGQFVEGLISRVQLLQDAVTGIISIDQNDIVKVLTIASVVGIPPILVRDLWDEFQVYAGIELGLGLSIRSGPDRRFDRLAPALVQNEGLDVIEVAMHGPPSWFETARALLVGAGLKPAPTEFAARPRIQHAQ